MVNYILWYLGLVNIVTFVVWGIDKYKAIKKKRRISEKKLLILTIFWGFIWAIAGMQLFRHKTIKSKFLYYFWAIVLIWFVWLGIFLYNI